MIFESGPVIARAVRPRRILAGNFPPRRDPGPGVSPAGGGQPGRIRAGERSVSN